MQSRYFIMSELAAIAHDMDLLLAQLNHEQEETEKREKEMATAPRGTPVPGPHGFNRIDKELSFIQVRLNALCDYYTEEVRA